jgi:hypothetical protein
MSKARVIALSAVLVVACLLLVVAAVLQLRYGALLPSPRIGHEDYVLSRTVCRVLIQPAEAQDMLSERIARRAGIPKWAVSMSLPHEVALMYDPDLTQGTMSVAVFVNTRRLDKAIVETANAQNMLDSLPIARWDEEGVALVRPGVLLVEGQAPIRRNIVALVEENWGIVSPLTPLELDGGHFFEAVLDLRDGRGFPLIASWMGESARPSDITHPTQLVVFMKDLASIRVSGDMMGPDEMRVVVAVESMPNVDSPDTFLYNSVMAGVEQALEEYHGVQIEGEVNVEDLTITGTYAITNLEGLFAALGLPGEASAG